MTTNRKCPTHHESKTGMPYPPSRCRAVNAPQSQKSCPLSLFRRHLFGFLEPRSPPTLKIKKTVSGLTSCFKFMTLSWDWSCARPHICERPPSFWLTPPHFCASIRPPDVGGMRQNSAAPLLFSSASRSMLVSVSARGSHRACEACREERPWLREETPEMFSWFVLNPFKKKTGLNDLTK